MCSVIFRFLYLTHHFPPKKTHTCIINVTNSNDSSYLLSDQRPTLKKDSNDYNNAGQGTFFQYRVENLPKKKIDVRTCDKNQTRHWWWLCLNVSENGFLTPMPTYVLPDKGFARHTRWSKSTKQYNLGLFWNKKASF